MKRLLLAALAALSIALSADAQFSFRTTGEQAFRIFTVRPTDSSLGVPPLSDANHVKFWVPGTGHAGYSAGQIYISQSTGPWTRLSSFVGSGAVASVFGRTGTIVALQADYDSFYASNSGTETISGAWNLGSLSTATTQTSSDNDTSLSTTAFVKTALLTPTITSFASATHNHTNAAGGGQITTSALSDNSTIVKTSGAQTVAGAKDFSSGLFERGRASATGEKTDVTYSAGNFSQDSGTFTVDSADQVYFRYWVVGKALTIQIKLQNVSFTGAPWYPKVTIPGGYSAVGTTNAIMAGVFNNGVAVAGPTCRAQGGFLFFVLHPDAAWTASTNNTSWECLITVPVV